MSRIRFDHIAIAMTRIDDAAPFLMGELGGVPDHGSPSGVYRFGQWRFLGGGRIEILEPLGEDGFLHRFLRERGPGIHHVTFKVPSLGDVCDRARARGYTIVGYDGSDPGWKEAFLHPKQALGIVVQFAESRSAPSLRRWQPPPGPANPRPPVTVLGLRMRARSRERALTQWGLVLEGECVQDSAGALVYRWPGSPMRLAVEIDPASDEGPVAIELASDRPVSLPEGPHPLLGALFTRCAG
ncbi:MAG: VOC family protein [Candidatus Rokubacteria bacterium]|nr:VOC family protein [Candidatus Rokubacteria bacterium]